MITDRVESQDYKLARDNYIKDEEELKRLTEEKRTGQLSPTMRRRLAMLPKRLQQDEEAHESLLQVCYSLTTCYLHHSYLLTSCLPRFFRPRTKKGFYSDPWRTCCCV